MRGVVVAATGLRAEARVAQRSGFVKALAGGGNEQRLASLIERSIANGGIRGLISFGIAGGLRPGLASGTIVVGTSVVSGGTPYMADERWSDRLFEAVPNAESGAIVGAKAVISEPGDKQKLYMATGAFAADMESHIVARLAAEHQLPFAVLRVIADTSKQRLPPAAVNGLKPDGTPDIAAVLKSLMVRPGQLPSLLLTANATRRAMRGLFRCYRLLGPGLGFADLR